MDGGIMTPKIQWKKQTDIDAEKEKQAKRQTEKDKLKKKSWQNMSSKEKDEVLRLVAIQLGMIDDK